MLYILGYSYTPNTAAANRLLGYFRAIDQMGVEANVVYIHPDKSYHRVNEKFSKLKFTYLWNKFLPYRGFFGRLTFSLYLNSFLKRLKPGDVVYTYCINALTKACLNVDGVRVYAESTEHPDASSGFSSPLVSIDKKEYLETLLRLDGLFVISEPLKEYYSSLGLNVSKIKIINMTVDASRFENIKKTPAKDRYIAYCGTVSNNKDGVDELIKAFAVVAKKIQDIKLYIIGTFPDKNEKSGNLNLIKSLGLQNRIVFTGLVRTADMPQLLMNADVLALDRPDNLQSKYGFPTKLGEYLLTGNPVVVTSVGDIPKFLKDGESALIAKPSDSEDFSNKLIYALSDNVKAVRIGKCGKSVAIENFDNYKETQKLISILISTINK